MPSARATRATENMDFTVRPPTGSNGPGYRIHSDYRHANAMAPFIASVEVIRVQRCRAANNSAAGAIKAKGACLRTTEQRIATRAAGGKCCLDMLGVFAEFEINLPRPQHSRGPRAGLHRGLLGCKPPECRGRGSAHRSRPWRLGRHLPIKRATQQRCAQKSGLSAVGRAVRLPRKYPCEFSAQTISGHAPMGRR
jgi:hypothetical protein